MIIYREHAADLLLALLALERGIVSRAEFLECVQETRSGEALRSCGYLGETCFKELSAEVAMAVANAGGDALRAFRESGVDRSILEELQRPPRD